MTAEQKHWQNLGAQTERKAILRAVRKAVRGFANAGAASEEIAVAAIAEIILTRSKRTAKRAGGLGRR